MAHSDWRNHIRGITRFTSTWPAVVQGSKQDQSGRYWLTPAMAAGVVDRLWKIEDLYDAVMK